MWLLYVDGPYGHVCQMTKAHCNNNLLKEAS